MQLLHEGCDGNWCFVSEASLTGSPVRLREDLMQGPPGYWLPPCSDKVLSVWMTDSCRSDLLDL